MEQSADGNPYPYVREVAAYYEDGVFYVTTWAKSNKMQQIAKNKEVAFAVCFEGIYGIGVGENLGWVLDPKNAEIRAKLRKVFINWYDQANNEQDENCVILAIHITRGRIFRKEGSVRYNLDFVNKIEIEKGKISNEVRNNYKRVRRHCEATSTPIPLGTDYSSYRNYVIVKMRNDTAHPY